MAAQIREKTEARKQAAREEPIVEAAIINVPANAGQAELILRAIGKINPVEVGHILSQIDVREPRVGIAEVHRGQVIQSNYKPANKPTKV